MRRLYILLFCILFLGLITKLCFSEEGEIYRVDGYKWTSWHELEKGGWAIGFNDGLNRAYSESVRFFEFFALRGRETLKEVDPTIGERIDEISDSLVKILDLSGITFGQIVDGLDKFYKDYRNKGVLAEEGVWIVKLEMRGAPQEFIDEEARIIRMPIGERLREWSSLNEKNQAYKEAWAKWGGQIPCTLHW